MKTTTERQQDFAKRKRQAGLARFCAWVTPAQKAQIEALLRLSGSSEPQASPEPQKPVKTDSGKPARRKRKPVDPVAEKNRQIVDERCAEIEARRQAGEKPTATAEWLRQFGFVGTGATLNGLAPWR